VIPKRLQDWTYERIDELTNENESEIHDFKSDIPSSKELSKDCCAFANSNGGFIIFGVIQNGNRFRIEGIDNDIDLANEFGKKIHSSPRIRFDGPKIISKPNSTKILAVFNIPLSPVRPHIPTPVDQRIFYKRTNTGNEQMTYEEIKDAFRELLTKKYKKQLNEIKFRILFKLYQLHYQSQYPIYTSDLIELSGLKYFNRNEVLGEIFYLHDSGMVKEKDPMDFLSSSSFDLLRGNIPIALIITSKGIDVVKKAIEEFLEHIKEYSESNFKQIDTITDINIKLNEMWRVLNQNYQLQKLFFDK
jgi:predicted HTH transcriptional regulator